MFIWLVHACGGQMRALDILELGLQTAVSSVWASGTEPRSSARMVNVLNLWATSATPDSVSIHCPYRVQHLSRESHCVSSLCHPGLLLLWQCLRLCFFLTALALMSTGQPWCKRSPPPLECAWVFVGLVWFCLLVSKALFEACISQR